MADPKNPKDVRSEFAADLTTELVSTAPKLCHEILDHRPSEFGKTPVVALMSAGTRRKRRGAGTQKYSTIFRMEVMIFVPAPDGDWTASMAEDRLNDIETRIAKAVAENRTNSPYWRNLYHDEDFSDVAVIPSLAGRSFLTESTFLWAVMED